MAAEIPFHLQYELSRRQRLVPHLRIWVPGLPLVAASVLMFALCVFAKWWLFPLLLLVLWFCKGFWIGLIDVVAHPVRKMDVIVEENGLGFLVGGQRWWIFLDGVVGIDRFCRDTWTIRHHNGHVINIPVSAISEEQLQHIRDAAKKGHTPEGIHGVLERGRRLQEMRKERRRRKRDGEA